MNPRHRYLTAFGETRKICDWAKLLGIKKGMIHDRLKSGWSVEDILSVPKLGRKKIYKPRRLYEYDGLLLTADQWAAKYNFNKYTLRSRLYYGWSVHDAVSIPVGGSNERSTDWQQRVDEAVESIKIITMNRVADYSAYLRKCRILDCKRAGQFYREFKVEGERKHLKVA